jgi:2-C-methyl-D-erythritol 4-phosphate cytidylyltransferase
LTQALSEEWAGAGIKVNVVNPERTLTPMRVHAFGMEEPRSLLSAEAVARTSLDVLASSMTGFVVDVRRDQRAE